MKKENRLANNNKNKQNSSPIIQTCGQPETWLLQNPIIHVDVLYLCATTAPWLVQDRFLVKFVS